MNMLGRKVSLFGGLLAVAAFLLAASVQAPARAAQPVASLDVVPADAAFYSALLRNREQYEAIVNSKAFAKIKDLPYVQMGLQALASSGRRPRFARRHRPPDPEVKKSLAFLADIFSDEVFVYGDADFNQTIELVQGVSGAVQYDPALAGHQPPMASSNGRDSGPDVGSGFAQELDLIKLPDLVIGCKVKDQAAGEGAVGQAGSESAAVLAQLPPTFKDCLKKATIDGHSYLTITLGRIDGTLGSRGCGEDPLAGRHPRRRRQADRTTEEDHTDHLAGPARRLPAAGDRPFDRRAGPVGQGRDAAFAAGIGCRGQVRRQADLLGRLPEQGHQPALQPDQGRHR